MATARADVLTMELGDGWEPRVRENLGWHWSAVRGGLKVHPASCPPSSVLLDALCSASAGYLAFLGEANSVGGKWVSRGETPTEAVRNVVKCAMGEIKSLLAIVDGVFLKETR